MGVFWRFCAALSFPMLNTWFQVGVLRRRFPLQNWQTIPSGMGVRTHKALSPIRGSYTAQSCITFSSVSYIFTASGYFGGLPLP